MIEASCDVTTCDVLLNWLLLCCCRSTENGQSPPARSPKKVSHDHDLELSLLQLYIIQSCVVVNVTFCFNNMTAISQKPCPAQTHSSFVVSSSVLEAVFPKGIVPYARTQLLLGVVFSAEMSDSSGSGAQRDGGGGKKTVSLKLRSLSIVHLMPDAC